MKDRLAASGSGGLGVFLDKARRLALEMAARAWPELGTMADAALPNPMDPVALLPVATGMACGASLESLLPVSSAVILMALALRILDDCADEDNPDALYLAIGTGRAVNAAAALSAEGARAWLQLPLPIERREGLVADYLASWLKVSRGQDADIRGSARTLAEYEEVVNAKTVAAYEFAAIAGARAAVDDGAAIARCSQCGQHLGWMTQILDDIEALWFPVGPGDLQCGRFTFPIFYGLSLEDSHAAELRELCSASAYDEVRICALLDEMDVRGQLVTRALDHRDAALAALSSPLAAGGLEVLQPWMDWKLGDVARLIG
jgi:geranylgeranyl diphosphate synthase type I